MMRMVEWVDNNFKTDNIPYVLKPKKNIKHDMFRDIEEIIKKQTKLLEMKSIIS